MPLMAMSSLMTTATCILSIPLSSSLILVASTHTIAYRREQVRNSVMNGVAFRDAIIFVKKLKIITIVFRRLLEESEKSCKFVGI